MVKNIIIFLLIGILTGSLVAGTTGKIVGVVSDKDSKEPLIGVNIEIAAIQIGASTDADGYYFINNIPPGVYQLKVTYLGYTNVEIENVRISVDHTTEINVTMAPGTLDLGDVITVVAERPLVEKDITSRRSVIDGNQITDRLPVSTMNKAISLQAGVVQDEDGQIHIRGGRFGEVAYLIDGTYVRDPFDNSLGGNVDLEAIQEMEIISGTFNAEYGNAMSGVVNIVTKEGTRDYHLKLQYESPMLNESPYHQADWLLNTDEVKNLSEAERENYRDAVRTTGGESAYQRFKVLNSQFASGLTGLNMLGRLNARISGPVPFVPKLFFFVSGTGRNEDSYLPYGFDLERVISSKVTYNFNPSIKMQFNMDWSNHWYQDYDHQYKYWQYFDALDQGGYPLTRDLKTRYTFKMTHTLNRSTYYTASLSRVYNFYKDAVTDKVVTTNPGTGDLLSTEYVQRGYYQGIEGNFRTGDVRYWTLTKSTTWDFDMDFISQIRRHHQLKSGIEFRQHEIFRHQIGMPVRPITQYFTRRPVEFAAYAQDKIELDFLIVNLGLRFDYYDPKDLYYPDPGRIIQILTDASGQSSVTTVPEEKVKPRYKLSPRVGFAHPITATTVFHFAYGQFFQIPRYYDLYRDNSLEDILANDALIGNPGLEPEKTVAFEAGVKQQLGADYGLDITAYYKDISNLISSFYYFSGRDYTIFINADYGKVQGIDVTLNKRHSNYFSGAVNYTFMIAKGNESDPIEGYSQYREDAAHLKPNRNFYLDFDRRHNISVNLDLRFPGEFGPSLLGFRPLEYLSANFLFTAASGLPYTPTSRDQDATLVPEKNSARKPAINQLDLRISREFHMRGGTFNLYTRIDNLFDTINVLRVWTATGKAWDGGSTSNYPKDRQANPESVDIRRTVRAGLIIRF